VHRGGRGRRWHPGGGLPTVGGNRVFADSSAAAAAAVQ